MSLVNSSSRKSERIEPMLAKIEEAWKLYPDMRLCQLIVVCLGTDRIFGVEDDILLAGVIEYIRKMHNAGVR